MVIATCVHLAKGRIIMTEKGVRRLRFAYGIGLSALTAIVGVLFIMQTWSIFLSGEQSPYTVEIISEKFMQILAPVCLWVLAVIGGGVLGGVFPSEKEKQKGYVDLRKTLTKLKGRLPENDGGMVELKKESRLRKIVWGACIAACIAGAVAVFAILFDQSYTPRFESEFFIGHGAAADRLIRITPYIGVCLLACLSAIFTDEYSIKRETAIVKLKIAENAKQGIKPVKGVEKKSLTLWEALCEKFPIFKSKWWKLGFQAGFCVLGLTLFIVGIFNGGMTDVFEKARNICTQCIGLG